MIERIKSFILKVAIKLIPQMRHLTELDQIVSSKSNNQFTDKVTLYEPHFIHNCKIGDYSYLGVNTRMSFTNIGKFCSIGPNFISGWGIHPTNGISTSPMFYSTVKQNGFSLTKKNKIEERKDVNIGHDVFIGMNVSVLDGVTIGDGAVIAAGSMVTKDVPSYAMVGGVPAKIIKYRFNEDQIEKLLKIKWWDFPEEKLQTVEKHFFDIDTFINNCLEKDNEQSID